MHFLELLYDDRVESIVVMHRVGATVGLADGSMVIHVTGSGASSPG